MAKADAAPEQERREVESANVLERSLKKMVVLSFSFVAKNTPPGSPRLLSCMRPNFFLIHWRQYGCVWTGEGWRGLGWGASSH